MRTAHSLVTAGWSARNLASGRRGRLVPGRLRRRAWQGRADESFNVTSSTWTSNTWYGYQPAYTIVKFEAKLYAHNGNGTVLGETWITCGPPDAKHKSKTSKQP